MPGCLPSLNAPYRYHYGIYDGIISPPTAKPEPAPEKDVLDSISAVIKEAAPDMRERVEAFQRSASEYFPLIKRGFIGAEEPPESGEVVAVGWKHDVVSRKDREEALRYVRVQ